MRTKCIIQRTEYQDAVDLNDNNIKQSPQYYKRRQAICEHLFGSIKRQRGYTFTLLKGLQKVSGEMNLIMFCYNLMRTKNRSGFQKMLQAIHNWTRDSKKVSGFLKTATILAFFNPNRPPVCQRQYLGFFKEGCLNEVLLAVSILKIDILRLLKVFSQSEFVLFFVCQNCSLLSQSAFFYDIQNTQQVDTNTLLFPDS